MVVLSYLLTVLLEIIGSLMVYFYRMVYFNHESPRRGVTAKVVKGALDIKYKKKDKLELGNLDSYRDWGHSFDYTKAMIKLLEADEPLDIVISTGKAHSVRNFMIYV